MKYITSKKNDLVQKIRYLHTKKGRDELSLFIVEGKKLTGEALDAGCTESVIFSETLYRLQKGIVPMDAYVLRDDVFEYVSDTVNPQGVMALVRIRDMKIGDSGLILLAEELQDPGNLGTLIRTGESFGVGAVYLSPKCADPYNMKSVRSSMGSVLRMPLRSVADAAAFIEQKRVEGYYIIAGHLEGMDISKGFEPVSDRVLLVIGNESRGLSEQAAQKCDMLLKIPIYGGNESLNAAVAAGIILYELRKKISRT